MEEDQASDDSSETVSVEMLAETSNSAAQNDENPWPHLKDCFSFKFKRANSIIMQCQMCLPKVTELAAFNNSTSNLQKHVLVNICAFKVFITNSKLPISKTTCFVALQIFV